MGITTYETILELERDNKFIPLIKRGLIPINVMDYKVIYEAFNAQCQIDKRNEAALTVAAHYNIARSKVYRVIAYMERKAN